MFGNKKDPLVDATKKVMEKSEKDRQIIAEINNELGIVNPKQLPHEQKAIYDEYVAQQLKEGIEQIDEGSGEKRKFKKFERKTGMNDAKQQAYYQGQAGEKRNYPKGERKKAYEYGKQNIDEVKFKGDEAPFEADEKKSTPWTSPKSKAKNLARQAMKQMKDKKEKIDEDQVNEASYSAKAARAGKDIGKPGKMFSKIEKEAGKRYGSEEKGKKVAGAILAKIRAKHMEEGTQLDEATRKHFQMVADLIKGHDSQDKRNELASHHSEIFTKQNPRFDKAKFYKASGAEMPKKLEKGTQLDEKLTKSMSAGDVISDFVHSKNPKFAGKSTKERQKMALGAYYGMHSEKSKKTMEEKYTSLESIQEEIRNSLLEKAHWLNENGTQEQVVEFLNNLTMEQRDILKLDENSIIERVTPLGKDNNDAEGQLGGFYGQGSVRPLAKPGLTDQSYLGKKPAGLSTQDAFSAAGQRMIAANRSRARELMIPNQTPAAANPAPARNITAPDLDLTGGNQIPAAGASRSVAAAGTAQAAGGAQQIAQPAAAQSAAAQSAAAQPAKPQTSAAQAPQQKVQTQFSSQTGRPKDAMIQHDWGSNMYESKTKSLEKFLREGFHGKKS